MLYDNYQMAVSMVSFLSDLSIFKIDCSLYKHWPTITFLKPRLGSQSPPRLSPFSASSLATSSACAAVYSTPQKRRKATLVEFSARHNPLQQLTVSRKKSGDEPMYLLDQKSLSKTISLVAHALFGCDVSWIQFQHARHYGQGQPLPLFKSLRIMTINLTHCNK